MEEEWFPQEVVGGSLFASNLVRVGGNGVERALVLLSSPDPETERYVWNLLDGLDSIHGALDLEWSRDMDTSGTCLIGRYSVSIGCKNLIFTSTWGETLEEWLAVARPPQPVHVALVSETTVAKVNKMKITAFEWNRIAASEKLGMAFVRLETRLGSDIPEF